MTSVPQPVWLRHSDGSLVAASLVRGLNEQHIELWRAHWFPAREAALSKQAASGQKLPEHAHWDWERKLRKVTGLLGFAGYAIECDGIPQGLMLLDLNQTAKVSKQKGKPLVYVQYVEVAPWNSELLVKPIRYRGVGSLLIRAAIERSIDEEFHGRVGLVALPQAEGFYRNTIGMTDLGPQLEAQGLRYFELTEAQANAFVAKTGG